MAIGRAWQWVLADFKRSLVGLDPSKLMIAPILFVGTLAVIDRSAYEIERSLFPERPERLTRLSAAEPLPPTIPTLFG